MNYSPFSPMQIFSQQPCQTCGGKVSLVVAPCTDGMRGCSVVHCEQHCYTCEARQARKQLECEE